MAKKLMKEIEEVLDSATPEYKEENIPKEVETKLKEQVKRENKSSRSGGGVRL